MAETRTGIIGNSRTIEFLLELARSPYLGHAYLFTGPDGVGKRLASLAFAKAINCTCDIVAERCESCQLMDSLNHPEVLVLEDAQKPRWLRRKAVAESIARGRSDWPQAYRDVVSGLFEKGYLKEPLPRIDRDIAVDGFRIDTDEVFGKGSVPSKECYTPKPISDRIRKLYDRGDLAEEEYQLLKLLYEYPLSVMPYRGAIPIAYVTTRQGWKFTRPIQAFLSMKTMMGGKKIVIVDDAHKMTPEAQNCLLKTLEEPPADSVLILITSDRRALFETIVSRCQVVTFGRLSRVEVDAAMGNLLGSAGDRAGLTALLSENCPGRLLELTMTDVETRLKHVRDMFNATGRGKPEAVLGFSRAVIAEAGGHRRQQRQAVGRALELVVFWIAEILRVKHGLPDRIGLAGYADALKDHAGRFGEASLLEATRRIEDALGLLRWNIDMGLLLDATLLRLALTLGLKTPGVRS